MTPTEQALEDARKLLAGWFGPENHVTGIARALLALADENADLRAKLAAAEAVVKAARPFGELASATHGHYEMLDSDVVWKFGFSTITAGQLRKLAAALALLPAPQKNEDKNDDGA